MKTVDQLYQDVKPLIDNGWYEAALAALEKLVVSYDFAPAHSDLGVLYFNSGGKEKALYHFCKSVELEPENIIFNKTLADYYLSEMDAPQNALPIYEKILTIQPENIEVLLITAHIHVAMKRFLDAENLYKKVLEIEPSNEDVLEFLDKLKQNKTAVNESESPDEIYDEIQEKYGMEDSEEIIMALEKLLDLYPDFPFPYNDLGLLYVRTGHKNKALANYLRAVELQPENITFQKNLADFWYAESGRPQKALEIYVQILAKNPCDIDALMIAGNISADIGKIDDASFFYDRVMEIEPWNTKAFEAEARLKGENKPDTSIL